MMGCLIADSGRTGCLIADSDGPLHCLPGPDQVAARLGGRRDLGQPARLGRDLDVTMTVTGFKFACQCRRNRTQLQ
jgi:hypothetical protein